MAVKCGMGVLIMSIVTIGALVRYVVSPNID
jgi:hypothetical protein